MPPLTDSYFPVTRVSLRVKNRSNDSEKFQTSSWNRRARFLKLEQLLNHDLELGKIYFAIPLSRGIYFYLRLLVEVRIPLHQNYIFISLITYISLQILPKNPFVL